METKMTQDEFTQFIAHTIIRIDCYQFDIMYDVAKIVNQLNEKRGASTTEPQLQTYHLMIRSTGCDMVEPTDENYTIYKHRNDRIYELVFCWNYSYMHNIPFVTVEQL